MARWGALLLHAAVLSICGHPSAGEFNLTILHTNDVHSRYEQMDIYGNACPPADVVSGKCVGGVARRYAKIEEIRDMAPNTILLDAGDQFQGTIWFVVHQGNIAAHFMKRLRYDAMAMGNHELDLGVDGFASFLKEVNSSFPVVSCNMDVIREPGMQSVRRYVIVERGAQKIGIIGYTSASMPSLMSASNYGNLTFMDEVQSVKLAVTELREKGVKVIIALGHSGYDIDLRIASEVDEVDIVVGGHSHTFLYTGAAPSNNVPTALYPTVVNKASSSTHKGLVVQDYQMGKYLGHLDVTFDDEGQMVHWSGNPIFLDDTVKQDEDIQKDVAKWDEPVKAKGNEVIGSTNVFLNGNPDECRARECNIGNAIADAFLNASTSETRNTAQVHHAPSQLVVINAASIGASIGKGDILYQDVLAALPYQNTVDLVTLAGTDILSMFEHSVATYTQQTFPTAFLQVSGFKVVYHMYMPPQSRVASILLRCRQCDSATYEPLDLKKNYSIFMPSYMAAGGDRYAMIKEKRLSHEIFGKVDSDLFIDYIKAKSPLNTGVEQRLHLVLTSGSLGARHALSFNTFLIFHMSAIFFFA